MKEVCPARIDFDRKREKIEGAGVYNEAINTITCERSKCPLNREDPTVIRRSSQLMQTSMDAVEGATERLINDKCPLAKKDPRQKYTPYQGRPLNPANYA